MMRGFRHGTSYRHPRRSDQGALPSNAQCARVRVGADPERAETLSSASHEQSAILHRGRAGAREARGLEESSFHNLTRAPTGPLE